MEQMTAVQIREAVNAKLSEIGRAVTVVYMCERRNAPWARPSAEPWPCDEWRVEIREAHYHGPKTLFETEYYTGMGLRKAPAIRTTALKGSLAYENWEKSWKPKTPEAADVLHGILMTIDAASTSFQDWCSDLGYNDDSIHDFSVYTRCCEQAKALRKAFTYVEIDALRELTKDL